MFCTLNGTSPGNGLVNPPATDVGAKALLKTSILFCEVFAAYSSGPSVGLLAMANPVWKAPGVVAVGGITAVVPAPFQAEMLPFRFAKIKRAEAPFTRKAEVLLLLT